MFPVIDIDGYPTEETVEFLENWKNFKDAKDAMYFALTALRKMCYATVKQKNNYIYIATGGWSGCEDIVRAMNDNIWIINLKIVSTCGGGYYYVDPFVEGVKPYDFKVTVIYNG